MSLEKTPRSLQDSTIVTTDKKIVERLKEKKEPSLGELNPLLFSPDLTNPEAVEAITLVTKRLIDKYQGVQPDMQVVAVSTDSAMIPVVLRLVARFNMESLTEDQIEQIEEVAKQIYGSATRTRKNRNGSPIKPLGYPELENKKKKDGKAPEENGRLLGWYMGPNPDNVSTAHEGVFVHRDLGKASMANYVRGYSTDEWFFKPKLKDPITEKAVKTGYRVEVREASRYQTDIVEEIVQLSSILAHGRVIDHRQLLYEAYNDLNRLGLKKAGRNNIYGLDETIDYIERVLFLPLANLDLGSSIDLKAGSVLAVGVPGTGKTLIAEHFLSQDTGVFVVPVDPIVLAKDMMADPQKKVIIPRISQVFNDTGIPIVLHMDDIENIADNELQVNSTLLNLMAGVRESGFYVMASTNYPEKLSPQLLQPQRFAHLIYFGLPGVEARKGILEIHALQESKGLKKPLFTNKEEREIILEGIAANTDGFTSRFLAEICTRAKYHLLKRVALERRQVAGLSEEDLEGVPFTREDWIKAYQEVSRMYNKDGTIKRDEELKKFVDKHNKVDLGFATNHRQADGEKILTTFDELAAIQLKKKQT